MKKAIAIIVCLVMLMSMSVTAFAADTTHTLTINNPTKEHQYEAYQIFSGVLEKVSGTDTQVLTNIEWGSAIVGDGYDNSAALLNDIQDAAMAANNDSPMKKLLGVKDRDAAYLAEVMADNITSDSETLDALAAIFAKYIKAGSNIGTQTYTENIVTGDDGKPADKSYYTISGLIPGYYLVKDHDGSLDEMYDSYTKFILRVIKDETVSPKSSVPSVDKTINDTIDGTYEEYQDFDINDTAYYKWEGKLPSNLKDYEAYYYKFYDTLPTGIDCIQFEQVYLEGHDGNVVHTFYDAKINTEMPNGINKEINGKNVNLEFEDLLKIYPNILPTHKIVVKYSARVTRDALIATPMTNSVYVEFSNDPNAEGTGTGDSTGETPEDVAHAFTFQINVDKYDADNKEIKLEGAEFKLYYERVEHEVKVKYYAQVITEEMIAEGKVINGTVVDQDDLGVVYGWTTNESEASILDTDAKGAIAVRGLDEGIYYLKETKAPAGYNLMETPVKIEIIPVYTPEGDEVSVTVNYKVDDVAQDSNTVGVRNSSGSTLPVTGGMGTVLFYTLGSVLVIGTAVLLVVRKRLS